MFLIKVKTEVQLQAIFFSLCLLVQRDSNSHVAIFRQLKLMQPPYIILSGMLFLTYMNMALTLICVFVMEPKPIVLL